MKKKQKQKSARYGLSKKGMKKKKKTVPITFPLKSITTTNYASDEGFEFMFEPVEDTLEVEKTKDGYITRYLTPDLDAESPHNWGDDSLFLVHYHRDFDVRRKDIISEDDAKNWYLGEKIPQQKDYWIFPVEAYIHSGVHLSFDTHKGKLPQGHYEFDTSHAGLVLAGKEEFKSRKRAEKAARGLIETWNKYLSNEVYGIVEETYDKNKNQVVHDEVWGFYGKEEAMEEAINF